MHLVCLLLSKLVSPVELLISLIAPHTCMVCGRDGALLCEWCLLDACSPLPERCFRCKALSKDSRVCNSCRRASGLSYVWVKTDYEGAAKELVHVLKFERAKAAAGIIAELMEQQLPYLDDSYVITYVPTASTRYRQRGYDQSRLIAKSIAKKRHLPCADALLRHGHGRQVGARRSERLTQLKGAFTVIRPDLIAGKRVLVVDDVVTTGASLSEVSKVLKQAGVRSVSAAVFAQKL